MIPLVWVDDPLGIGLVQSRKNRLFDQVRVKRRYAIDPMRHDEGKFAHSDFAIADYADITAGFSNMGFLNGFDYLEMTWQDMRKHPFRPTLQCLGQQRMVGERETGSCRRDRRFHFHSMMIYQQTHEFRAGNGRMGVIEMNCHTVG